MPILEHRVNGFLQRTEVCADKPYFLLGRKLDNDLVIEKPTKIFTTEGDNFIYILEPTKNRLLQFDKESGDFVKQYKSKKFDDLTDLAIIEDGQAAYLLNDNVVYQIELQS